MGNRLEQFAQLLQAYGCGATFPITAVALGRSRVPVQSLAHSGVELAIHGYTHTDYSELSAEEQIADIARALFIFEGSSVHPRGYRCPYLRWNSGTLTAIRHHRLLYDSSQALAWDVLEDGGNDAYRRALEFYRAWAASEYPSLPRLDGDLICIPYSLPDDEALVERLELPSGRPMAEVWLAVLRRAYQLGELFTVGLHPERIKLCQEALEITLKEAQSLVPRAWIARLDEIATWWKQRLQTEVAIDGLDDALHLTVDGPPGVTILARGVEVSSPTVPWGEQSRSGASYVRVLEDSFTVYSSLRPFVAVSPDSPLALVDFLRQQGYIVEISDWHDRYSVYLRQTTFGSQDERKIISQIETSDYPLVRLGRWPDGARGALSITGDVDGLTLWDYGLRAFGR